jgi:hypothetical protein
MNVMFEALKLAVSSIPNPDHFSDYLGEIKKRTAAFSVIIDSDIEDAFASSSKPSPSWLADAALLDNIHIICGPDVSIEDLGELARLSRKYKNVEFVYSSATLGDAEKMAKAEIVRTALSTKAGASADASKPSPTQFDIKIYCGPAVTKADLGALQRVAQKYKMAHFAYSDLTADAASA